MPKKKQTRKLIEAIEKGRNVIAIDTNYDTEYVCDMLAPVKDKIFSLYHGLGLQYLNTILDIAFYPPMPIIIYSSHLLGKIDGADGLIQKIRSFADVLIEGEIDWEAIREALADFKPEEPRRVFTKRPRKA